MEVDQSWGYTIFSSRRADARSGHRWFLYERDAGPQNRSITKANSFHGAAIRISFRILDAAALSINMQIITLHIQALHNNKSLWIVEVDTGS